MNTVMRSFTLFLWVLGLTGVIYPLLITLIGHVFFYEKVQGSLVEVNGQIIGSLSLAQNFKSPKYFWPRPSARDFSLLPAGGSQLNPGNPLLAEQVLQRRKFLAESHHKPVEEVPQDLLFTSGSGVDPSISLAAAQFQVDRVVQARHWDAQLKNKLNALIQDSKEHNPSLFPGQPAVNIVKLNLGVDQIEKENQHAGK